MGWGDLLFTGRRDEGLPNMKSGPEVLFSLMFLALFDNWREREREREREGEKEGGRERDGGRGRERERKGRQREINGTIPKNNKLLTS